MDYHNYIERKAAGLVSIKRDAVRRRYFLASRRWDAATGQETSSQDELLNVAELQERKVDLQAQIAQINRMLLDIAAFANANPLPPE